MQQPPHGKTRTQVTDFSDSHELIVRYTPHIQSYEPKKNQLSSSLKFSVLEMI
jgi:hypothetical protein